MSRSRRKRPFVGITTAQSEKQDKREANRSLRRVVKAAVRGERETVPEIREVANVYSFAKDGRRRFNPRGDDSKWMRK
jgi:hypothetical protein